MGMFDFLKPKKKAWKPTNRVLTPIEPRPQDRFSDPLNAMNPLSPLNPMYGDSMSGIGRMPSQDYTPPSPAPDCTPDYGSSSDSSSSCSDGGGGGGD